MLMVGTNNNALDKEKALLVQRGHLYELVMASPTNSQNSMCQVRCPTSCSSSEAGIQPSNIKIQKKKTANSDSLRCI